METIDIDDPCEVARICPPGLMDVPLSEIPMPLRCQEALVQQKVANLRQLQSRCQNTFPRLARFGPASARDLAEALRRFIMWRASHESVFVGATAEDDSIYGAAPARTLLEELDKFVANLSESRRKVFDERVMGQKGLREVGNMLEVSSQRASQIEQRVRAELAKQPWVKDLRERLLALLSGRSEPLFLDLVEVDDPWFSGLSSRSREFTRLMCFLQWELTVVLLQGREIVSQISQNRFDGVAESIISFLAKKVEERWSRERVELYIEGELRFQGAPELAGYVTELLRPALHYSLLHGEEKGYLCSVGGGVNEIILAMVQNSEWPLHYIDIARTLSVRLGERFKSRNIEQRLSNIPGLLCFGRGRYGSESHYPVSAEAEAEVAGMVADIMAGGPERLWHVDELLKAMEARGKELADDLDKQILNILLSRSEEFRKMGRMTWSLKAAPQSHE